MLQGQLSGTQFPDPHTAALHVEPISPHPTSCPSHNQPQAGRTFRPYRRRSVVERTAPCLSHLRRQCIRSEKSSRAFEAYSQTAYAFLVVRQVLCRVPNKVFPRTRLMQLFACPHWRVGSFVRLGSY